jgi:hypothetical protein
LVEGERDTCARGESVYRMSEGAQDFGSKRIARLCSFRRQRLGGIGPDVLCVRRDSLAKVLSESAADGGYEFSERDSCEDADLLVRKPQRALGEAFCD